MQSDSLQVIANLVNNMPLPVIIVNGLPVVRMVNSKAAQVLELGNSALGDIRLGQLLECNNAINVGVCNTTFFCTRCKFSQVINKVIETRSCYNDQVGTIFLAIDYPGMWWRIKFDAAYIGAEENLVMLTLKSLTKCEQQESNIPPGHNSSNTHAGQSFESNYINLASEGLLNALFANSSSALLFFDKNGEVEKWNPRFLELAGVNPGEAIDKPGVTGFLNKTGLRFGITNLDEDGTEKWEPVEKVVIENFAGEQRVVQASFFPCHDARGRFIGNILRIDDKTEKENLLGTLELHKLSLEYSPSVLYYVNRDGEIVYANRQAREITGMDFETLPRKRVQDINPIAVNGWWEAHVEKLDATRFVETETLHVELTGNHRPVIAHIFRPDREQPGIYCYYCHNIIENSELKELLIRESRVNQSMAEVSSELTRYSNTTTPAELLVRQYALEITGSLFGFIVYDDPLTGSTKYSIYSDLPGNIKDRVKIIEAWVKTHLLSGTNGERLPGTMVNDTSEISIDNIPFNQMLPFRTFAASGIYLNSAYRGMILVAGNEKGYPADTTVHLQSLANLFGIAINRVKQSKLLSDSLEQLELAMSAANICTWDAYPHQDQVILNNHAGESNAQVMTRQVLKLSSLTALIPREDLDRLSMAAREHVESNSAYFRQEFKTIMTNGRPGWVETTGRVIEAGADGTPKRITGVATDVTKRVKMTLELLKTREEAIAANMAKGKFLAKVSHEFRTPLNAIIGFADLLKNHVSGNLQQSYIDGIKSSGTSLLDMVTDILDYSKIEADKIALKIAPVDIRWLVQQVSNLFEPILRHKDIEFKVVITQDIPKLLLLDELKVRQILTNLVSNALKFTEAGSVMIQVDSTFASPGKINLSLVVVDTGIGIKPEAQATIFDDFAQQDDLDNRRYGGTGLGLAIVKKLVLLMQGRVELDSAPGIGSKFAIHLFNCEVVDDKMAGALPVKINGTVPQTSVLPAIKNECREAILTTLENSWKKFRLRPSFNQVPVISLHIKELAGRFNDNVLLSLANRLEDSINAYNVEELNNVSRDFEAYAGLKNK